MTVVASVHIADVGPGRALGLLRKVPRPGTIDGLRQANVAAAMPLRASTVPAPSFGRVAMVAFWDDDDAVERFAADHPLGEKLRGGWSARLEPLRRHGSWPGLPDDVPTDRSTDYDGPDIVLTFGHLRLTRAIRFLRTSRKAETSALASPGMVWATAMARPPFVATCSLWRSTRELATYAYGARDPGHPDAITSDRAKPFHHKSAFVRFRPYMMRGSLAGKNPLPDHALT